MQSSAEHPEQATQSLKFSGGLLSVIEATSNLKAASPTMKIVPALTTFLALLAGSASADKVTSRLVVHIPQSLHTQNGYDHREALFGIPPYGGSIAQNVYYADSTLCDQNVDTTKGYPQRNNNEPWKAPYILMVDRGDCTFVQKVRNAQRSGAAAVLIADNTCLCADSECQSNQPCEPTEPIMADDGSGSDVSIPSFLIFKMDADKIKAELMSNRPVQVEMTWSLPAPDDRVEYDIWTVPSDQASKDFFMTFKKLALALDDRAYFTPHMYIYDGLRAGCQGANGENQCLNLCTNNGRYCALDPEDDLEVGISGADVVRESLRRLCIWNHYGSEDGIGAKWWDYVTQFNERCGVDADYFNSPDCIKDVYKHAGIDGDKVDRCMMDSGGLDSNAPNNKLDLEIASQAARGVVMIPTAFVNTIALRGRLTSSNIFQAICAGYAEGTAPAICSACGHCPDAVSCVENGACTAQGHTAGVPAKGVSTHTFASSMFLVIAIFSGLGVWHYKRTREEMREQVRGILAEYMPLEDNDGDAAPMSNPLDFARGGTTTNLIS